MSGKTLHEGKNLQEILHQKLQLAQHDFYSRLSEIHMHEDGEDYTARTQFFIEEIRRMRVTLAKLNTDSSNSTNT